MQFQAFFLTSLGDFPDYVTSERSGIHHIVGTRFGPEHRESVMMPCGDGEVLGSGGLEGADPLPRIELGRVEAIGKMGVFEVVEVAYLHYPFPLSEHGIYAPVNEDTETVGFEFFPCLEILLGRLVARLGLD